MPIAARQSSLLGGAGEVVIALDLAGAQREVGVTWTGGEVARERIVWDAGPGLGLDTSEFFAPWYTTKARGAGLGLATTSRLVRAHGWTIEACRRNDKTIYVVRIPARDLVFPEANNHLGTRPRLWENEGAGDGLRDPKRAGAA